MIKGAYTRFREKGRSKSSLPNLIRRCYAASPASPRPRVRRFSCPLQHPCPFSKHDTSMLTPGGTITQGRREADIPYVFRTNQSHLYQSTTLRESKMTVRDAKPLTGLA